MLSGWYETWLKAEERKPLLAEPWKKKSFQMPLAKWHEHTQISSHQWEMSARKQVSTAPELPEGLVKSDLRVPCIIEFLLFKALGQAWEFPSLKCQQWPYTDLWTTPWDCSWLQASIQLHLASTTFYCVTHCHKHLGMDISPKNPDLMLMLENWGSTWQKLNFLFPVWLN